MKKKGKIPVPAESSFLNLIRFIVMDSSQGIKALINELEVDSHAFGTRTDSCCMVHKAATLKKPEIRIVGVGAIRALGSCL